MLLISYMIRKKRIQTQGGCFTVIMIHYTISFIASFVQLVAAITGIFTCNKGSIRGCKENFEVDTYLIAVDEFCNQTKLRSNASSFTVCDNITDDQLAICKYPHYFYYCAVAGTFCSLLAGIRTLFRTDRNLNDDQLASYSETCAVLHPLLNLNYFPLRHEWQECLWQFRYLPSLSAVD